MVVVMLLAVRHNHPLLGDARINRPPSSRLPDPLSLVTNPRSQTSIARLLVERMGIWGVSWRAVVQEVQFRRLLQTAQATVSMKAQARLGAGLPTVANQQP